MLQITWPTCVTLQSQCPNSRQDDACAAAVYMESWMSMCWMVQYVYGCAIVRLRSACVMLTYVSLVYGAILGAIAVT